MRTCRNCGNTKTFIADAVSRSTVIVNSNGEFIDWVNTGTELPKIEVPYACGECQSTDIYDPDDPVPF